MRVVPVLLGCCLIGCGSDPVHHLPDSASIPTGVDLSSWECTTCAVLSDGHVGCWGANADGEIGDGTTDDALAPRLVPSVTTATQISVGVAHACARLADTTVSCWGSNASKQLDGTTNPSPVPVPVPG